MGKYVGLPPLPPAFAKEHPPIAIVEEVDCIGCERCPKICFFDAIVMKGKVALIIPENCTGCGLCFEACPVDCIHWVPDLEVAAEDRVREEVPGIDLGD
jgi:electron transport complex protein RnfB